ncbi:MAG: hypothetical protein U0802_22400 [Candidatus Binatia bacterium]
MLLPLGASVGVLLGWVHALRHFRRFGGLALSVLVLVRLYFAAQYEYFEMGRYLSYALPAVFLLGLFGSAELATLSAGWRPTWRRLATVGYVMLWFTLPLPGVPEFYQRPRSTPAPAASRRSCSTATPSASSACSGSPSAIRSACSSPRIVMDFDQPMTSTRYTYAVFGRPVPAPIFVRRGRGVAGRGDRPLRRRRRLRAPLLRRRLQPHLHRSLRRVRRRPPSARGGALLVAPYNNTLQFRLRRAGDRAARLRLAVSVS